ncbi:MAG: vWA domain-containing protein [Myxococcota bacterium]
MSVHLLPMNTSTHIRFFLGVVTATLIGAASGCASAETGGSGFDPDRPTKGGENGDGPNGFQAAAGPDGQEPGQMGLNGETCGAVVVEPAPVPAALFVAVDKSGSMDDNNKWVRTTGAFSSFFSSPDAAELDVALRFWPDADGCGLSCAMHGNGCERPEVDMGSLSDPAHRNLLLASFRAAEPNGPTPMAAALTGAIEYARDYKQTAPRGQWGAVVLMSDGKPEQCEERPERLGDFARTAYVHADIPVFAVGLRGSDPTVMDAIAAGGGTQRSYPIGQADLEDDLLEALESIRDSAASCTFAMPGEDDARVDIDPTLVNMVLSTGAGDTTVPQVAGGRAACQGGPGWFYDDPTNPTSMSLCDFTCEGLNSSDDTRLNVEIGCITVVR